MTQEQIRHMELEFERMEWDYDGIPYEKGRFDYERKD